ncbi:amino acid ABC transporter ATP-binding/permease protein [Devriesea agamarum]|uniref:amino acid ABC transporter ATP-binding/permease protein n=1 Tax=Devriesea agamarum TaxID=472569 RepID=UPI00071D04A9|nr:ABC transporter ATP-binding protein [Devriesea agamarum]
MTSHVRWLLGVAKPATRRLLGSVLARLLGHAIGAAMLALPAWAIGMLATGQAHGTGFAVKVTAVVVVLAVVKAACRYAEQLLGHLAAFGLMGEIRVWMIDRLIPQAPALTDGESAARLHTTAVQDVDRVEVFFAHTIAPAISAVLIPGASVCAAWVLAGWAPAVVLALVLAIGVIIPLVGAKGGREGARTVAAARLDIAHHLADSVRLRDDILSAEAVPLRVRHMGDLDTRLATELERRGRRAGRRHAANAARLWVGTLAVLLSGVVTLSHSADSLPGLLAAAALVAGTASCLDTIERLAGSLPAGLDATRRIRELAARAPAVDEPVTYEPSGGRVAHGPAPESQIEEPTAVVSLAPTDSSQPAVGGSQPLSPTLPSATPPSVAPPAAEFSAVSFAYPGREQPALDHLSLTALTGSVIGVVGATGSGKSTIARLLQRHWDPKHGNVQVNGSSLRVMGSQRVHQIVAVADQDPFLLDGTVADNLKLGDPHIQPVGMREALRIADLDLDLDAPVGRRGCLLSGGQRQRLALARTLVRAASNPAGIAASVLVLDEATSHQDPMTQARMVEKLKEVGATIVLVAHRLETLRNADNILVIERGRVVESGTWDDLVSAGGSFASLYSPTSARSSSAE